MPKNINASIICIGNELLAGELVDTNSAWLAVQFAELGITLKKIQVVADEISEIIEALKNAASCSEVIITSGGLGPTTDDLTREAISQFVDKELIYSEESFSRIKAFFEKRKRNLNKTNQRQAYFPQGATVIPNPLGTADAFITEVATPSTPSNTTPNKAVIISLPGVPRELKALFSEQIKTWLQKQFLGLEEKLVESFKVFGLSESYIGSVIEEIPRLKNNSQIHVAYRASVPEVFVKLSTPAVNSAQDSSSQIQELQNIKQEVIQALGSQYVFAQSPEKTLGSIVLELLKEKSLKLCLAESVTGGMVADKLVSISGASEVFLGSVVSYQESTKQVFLGVKPDVLRTQGSVSEEVALEMAEGALYRSGANISLGITGLAGPNPDMSGPNASKPVGTVCFALLTPEETFLCTKFFNYERNVFRQVCATFALDLIRRKLLGLDLSWEYK